MLRTLKYILVVDLILAIALCFVCVNYTFADTTTATGILDGVIIMSNAVYATARNAETGDAVITTFISIGQISAAEFQVNRGFLAFPVPHFDSAEACTLYLNGAKDYSDAEFEIYIVNASDYKSTLATADFDAFSGHQASGAYDGTVLNETWASTSYSADWNKIVFNSDGLSALTGVVLDTLWIALLSKEDYTASEPAGSEYMNFDSSENAGTEPYLSFTYTLATGEERKNFLYSTTPQVLYDMTPIPIWKP